METQLIYLINYVGADAEELGKYLLENGKNISKIYSPPTKEAVGLAAIIADGLSKLGKRNAEKQLLPIMYIEHGLVLTDTKKVRKNFAKMLKFSPNENIAVVAGSETLNIIGKISAGKKEKFKICLIPEAPK